MYKVYSVLMFKNRFVEMLYSFVSTTDLNESHIHVKSFLYLVCLVLNAGVIVDCLETSLYIYDSQTVGVRSMQLSYLFRNIYIYMCV